MQFDKEYDQALGVEETHRNGGSKVTVSLSKYKLVPENPIWDDSDDDDETLAAYLALDEDKRHIDWYIDYWDYFWLVRSQYTWLISFQLWNCWKRT